ncbi:MAG: radical SAM protein [Methanospirillum sp.]
MVGVFAPRLVSWNVTARCPLRCGHCYIDAGEEPDERELSTEQGRTLIDQLAAAGRPVLILSGGEPLLRPDIYDLARYATDAGLPVAMGTGGTLVTDDVAIRLAEAGVRMVAVSLDSVRPDLHDRLRGVAGTWALAVAGIEALRRQGVGVQLNTTIGQWNVGELDSIIDFGKARGIRDYQFFFLVPSGRAKSLGDLSPQEYEATIEHLLQAGQRPDVRIRPTCAPQFIRIASRMGLETAPWGRGCLAGLSYCRIDPTGTVTPCPYLPLSVGNVLEQPFIDIWNRSPLLAALRDPEALDGRCGRCEYRLCCGGCRARAFGAGRPGAGCGAGTAAFPAPGTYLDEDPGCAYEPGASVARVTP